MIDVIINNKIFQVRYDRKNFPSIHNCTLIYENKPFLRFIHIDNINSIDFSVSRALNNPNEKNIINLSEAFKHCQFSLELKKRYSLELGLNPIGYKQIVKMDDGITDTITFISKNNSFYVYYNTISENIKICKYFGKHLNQLDENCCNKRFKFINQLDLPKEVEPIY